MAAHDLRSPLSVILNYAQFLEAEAVLTPEQRDFVTAIKRTSRFMLGLVEDLLDVSTIEAGRLELNREPTDLVALVEQTVMLNRTLASPKQIVITFHPPAVPLAPLSVDPGKCQQVLNNLISNAVKFSPPGRLVDVTMDVSDDQVMIGVRDEGPGIAHDQLEKLFQPFSKTGARPTGGERSTGLGLVIVQRIVQGHGGEVRVESVVGAGSRFVVALPRGGSAA
jgi:signal transduction histidine kinase